jgi:hypothetical protein
MPKTCCGAELPTRWFSRIISPAVPRLPGRRHVWGLTMRSLVAAVAAMSFAGICLAQTEADILSFAEQGQKAMVAGQITPLQYYKELHRRISITPTADYPFKAENLRVIGFRVDVYEEVEAGRMTADRAERRIAEQQAAWEAENQAKMRGAEEARRREQQATYERQQAARAQDEAQRRALALQLLQSGAFRPQPYQLQPYQAPILQPATRCTSEWIGNQMQTICR